MAIHGDDLRREQHSSGRFATLCAIAARGSCKPAMSWLHAPLVRADAHAVVYCEFL